MINFESPKQLNTDDLCLWVEGALDYSEVGDFIPWLVEWFVLNQDNPIFVVLVREVCEIVRHKDPARYHSIHRDVACGLRPESCLPVAVISLMEGVGDNYKAEVGMWLLQRHSKLDVIEPYLWCIKDFALKVSHKEMDMVVDDVISRFGGNKLRDFQFFSALAYLLQGRVDRCNDVLSVADLGDRLKGNDEAALLFVLSCLSEGNSSGARKILRCCESQWSENIMALCDEWDGVSIADNDYYTRFCLRGQFIVLVAGTEVSFRLGAFSGLFESFYRRVKWRQLMSTSIVAASILDSLVCEELFGDMFEDSVLCGWDEDMWHLAAQVSPYLVGGQKEELRGLLYSAWQKDNSQGKKAAWALFASPLAEDSFSGNILVAASSIQILDSKYWEFIMDNLPLERYLKQFVESKHPMSVELIDFFDLEMVQLLIVNRRNGTLASISSHMPQESGWRVRLARLANLDSGEFVGFANLVLDDIKGQVPEHNLASIYSWVYPFLLHLARDRKQYSWASSRQQELENVNCYFNV